MALTRVTITWFRRVSGFVRFVIIITRIYMSRDNDDGFVVALYRGEPPRVWHDKSTRNIPALINHAIRPNTPTFKYHSKPHPENSFFADERATISRTILLPCIKREIHHLIIPVKFNSFFIFSSSWILINVTYISLLVTIFALYVRARLALG